MTRGYLNCKCPFRGQSAFLLHIWAIWGLKKPDSFCGDSPVDSSTVRVGEVVILQAIRSYRPHPQLISQHICIKSKRALLLKLHFSDSEGKALVKSLMRAGTGWKYSRPVARLCRISLVSNGRCQTADREYQTAYLINPGIISFFFLVSVSSHEIKTGHCYKRDLFLSFSESNLSST